MHLVLNVIFHERKGLAGGNSPESSTDQFMVENKAVTSEKLAHTIVEAVQDKKGIDVVLIDLREIHNAFTDFFVICSGNSDTQVDALKRSVEEMVHKKLDDEPIRVEGAQVGEWVLLDYVDVVAHVFLKRKREFFGLEELWGDGKITTYSNPE